MATEDERKLFVAGLPESMSEDELRQLFEATGGEVTEVTLPRDRSTGRVRGFGFVTFSSREAAQVARTELDGSVTAGRVLTVRAFQSEPARRGEPRDGGPRVPTAERERAPAAERTLYLGNLPYDCTPQQIEELLAQHRLGPVQRVHLPTGPDGRMRGYGFVTMATPEAVLGAIEVLRSIELRGRRLLANVAHPRVERPERSTASEPPRSARDSTRPPPARGQNHLMGSDEAVGYPDTGWGLEGRRRAERGEKEKKKRKKGRAERATESLRRGRERYIDWDDWDDEA